jgi:hypothetical protein
MLPPKTLPTQPSKLDFSQYGQIAKLEVLEDFSPFQAQFL